LIKNRLPFIEKGGKDRPDPHLINSLFKELMNATGSVETYPKQIAKMHQKLATN